MQRKGEERGESIFLLIIQLHGGSERSVEPAAAVNYQRLGRTQRRTAEVRWRSWELANHCVQPQQVRRLVGQRVALGDRRKALCDQCTKAQEAMCDAGDASDQLSWYLPAEESRTEPTSAPSGFSSARKAGCKISIHPQRSLLPEFACRHLQPAGASGRQLVGAGALWRFYRAVHTCRCRYECSNQMQQSNVVDLKRPCDCCLIHAVLHLFPNGRHFRLPLAQRGAAAARCPRQRRWRRRRSRNASAW